MIRSIQRLATLLLVVAAALTIAIWSLENVRWGEPACPRGFGHGLQDLRWLKTDEAPPTTGAERLLSRPNFGARSQAAGDLESGVVDRRLISTLLTISEEHSICVQTFKEGHRFLLGVEDGPTIPEGYGEAGGLPNTHYFGRAADIYWIDGEPVEGNGTNSAVLDVGRTLANIPPRSRPDQIIGPPGWTEQLGYGNARGWVLAQDQLDLHKDHLHLGYRDGNQQPEVGRSYHGTYFKRSLEAVSVVYPLQLCPWRSPARNEPARSSNNSRSCRSIGIASRPYPRLFRAFRVLYLPLVALGPLYLWTRDRRLARAAP